MTRGGLAMTAVLAAACACPQPAPVAAPPATPATPVGRAGDGAPSCPDGAAPERHAVTFEWTWVDPRPPVEIVDDPLDLGPPTRADRARPPAPPPAGIHLCGRWDGVAGAEMVACRASDGVLHGPVAMIAGDGSVLLEGWCERGAPLGLWLAWRANAVHRTYYNGKPVAPRRQP